MIFELIVDPNEMVYSPMGFRRKVLAYITFFCVAFPTAIYFIFEGHPQDPFQADSELFPFGAIGIVGISLLIWFVSFFQLKRSFHRMVVDARAREIRFYWQDLFQETRQTVKFESADSFLVVSVPVSRYASGWELRLRFRRGVEMPIAKFYKEAPAFEAADSANKIIKD